MSNEIQLANSGSPSVDPFGNTLAPAPIAQQSPMRKLHRLLRGHYKWLIGLALAGAVVGALVGWASQTPGYRSVGLIQVRPFVPSPDAIEKVIPLWQQQIQGQVSLLQSQRVIDEAVRDPSWKEARPNMPHDELVADFRNGLEVINIRNSTLIQVAFSDVNATTAQRAVELTIKSYERLYGNSDTLGLDRKITLQTVQRLKLQNDLNTSRAVIENLGRKYGVEQLDTLVDAKTREVLDLEKLVRQADERFAQAQNSRSTTQPTAPAQITPDIVRLIADSDKRMFDLVKERDAWQQVLDRHRRSGLGEDHRFVRNAKGDLEATEQRVQARALEYLKQSPGLPTSGGVAVTDAELNRMKSDRDNLAASLEREQAMLTDMARIKGDITNETRKMTDVQAALDEVNRRIDELSAQQALASRMEVISYGDKPVSYASDKRKQFAFVGFVGGTSMVVGAMLLFGFFQSRRFRFSDETHADLTGVSLLGILPDLPDRLSDPEQASIAAHCVHQIRTMMQINSGPSEQAFAVTSAASGDGKTSLTLALGLSYAACGTRVLLVDCDLIGGGLTARMNINAGDGVLEAVANRALLEYVRHTDISDVAILPVGTNQTHHASTLSPQALRRLIDDAKRHFDIILIDTGPVLGSIEASLVCAAADGVVLAVAHGQQRPLVEKSIAHLISIGAKLTGVVFNKAQKHDFERSISGRSMSLRAQRNMGTGQFGPVARAVASTQKTSKANE